MATRTCAAGVCNGDCSNGFADCDNNKQTTGCEVNTFGVNNCGPGGTTNAGHGAAAGCGVMCGATNAAPSCGAGTCVENCTAPFDTCDGNDANGCETNTNTSVTNCGACGVVCSTANITRTCSGGTCNGACTGAFLDCDGNKQTNGCECNGATSVCVGAACKLKYGQACLAGTDCASGNCNGGGTCGCSQSSDCGVNQACNTGTHVCQSACDGVTIFCNGGCCDTGGTGNCISGAGESDSACGNTGGACGNCNGNKHCMSNTCQ